LENFFMFNVAVWAGGGSTNREAIFGDAQHPRTEAFGFGSGAAAALLL
jgi:hypothetical protein